MNELTTSSIGQLVNRTPELIAAEINSIKNQTRNMVLYNSIEIGRRLVEAKALVQHGDWGEWLEKSVEYSKSTANNLMRIFEEYGSEQLTLLSDNAKSQALGNLGYTQAVALLGMTENEREQFLIENDIDNMSTRELQQAIKERDEARKEKEEVQKRLDNEKSSAKRLAEERDKLKTEAEGLRAKQEALKKEQDKNKAEVDRLNKLLNEAKDDGSSEEKIEKLENELQEAKNQVKQLTDEINKPGEIATTVVEKVPEELERELETLREKVKEQVNSAATIKYKVHFEEVVKIFKELLGVLDEIKETDVQAYEKYKNATVGLLDKMLEKLA